MSHWAYTVVMLRILCVALLICIAVCSVIDDRDSISGNILTPIPVVSSCLLPSQRFEDDKMAHLQPEPRQERRQLLVMFAADQFDDRPGRCDAGSIAFRLPTVSCYGRRDPAVRQMCALC